MLFASVVIEDGFTFTMVTASLLQPALRQPRLVPLGCSLPVYWLAMCLPSPRADPRPINQPVLRRSRPSPGLNVEDFRQELARLDGVCAKLNLSDERQLMSSWIVSDRSDAHFFLPIAADHSRFPHPLQLQPPMAIGSNTSPGPPSPCAALVRESSTAVDQWR